MTLPADDPAAAPHVGLFDSGIGGLSVLRAMRAGWPSLRCSYVADTACTPWGDRPADWVMARCEQLSAWLIEQGADLVLVACNTATTQAIGALRARWPQRPFVGVEPGIKPGVLASRNRRVAVMATSGTLRSHRLRQLVARHAGDARVLRLPCPGLAEAIERADDADPALRRHLDEIAATLRQAGVDTVVLGCTHYPLVADALQRRLGPAVRLIDTAEAVARRVAALLPPAGAARPGPADQPGAGAAPGQGLPGGARVACAQPPAPLRLLATGATAPLQRAARRWLPGAAGIDVERLPLPPPTLPPRP